MKRLRIMYVVGLALTITAVLLGIRVVQLRRQLARAEYFAQSGASSVALVCSGVSLMLRKFPHISGALIPIAERCLGAAGDAAEAQARAAELTVSDYQAIARRIDERIDERALPVHTMEPVTSGRLPKGYANAE